MSDFNMNEMGDVNPHTGSRQTADEGDYTVMISGAELETNKKANGTNLVMTYTILDGPFAGVEVKEWLAVVNPSEQAQNIARSKLQAIRIITGTTVDGDVKVLQGKTIRVRLSVEKGEYQGRETRNNSVMIYMTMEGKNAEGKDVPAFVPKTEAPSTSANSNVQSSNNQSSDQTSGGSGSSSDDDIPF